MTVADAGGSPEILFEEHLGATRRDWRWLVVILVVMYLTVSPTFDRSDETLRFFSDTLLGLTALAWLVNVLRYRKTTVVVDRDRVRVGRRTANLYALEVSTLGHAGNTWPWRAFNRRYLGANPVWTRDSVGVRGLEGGKRYWVAVGTNRRDELVTVLNDAIPEARARIEASGGWSASTRQALPPPSWHPDPWDPRRKLRWWDGKQWTGHTAPRQGATPPPALPRHLEGSP